MFIVTLVFEDFGENINVVFWGSFFLTNEEGWRFSGQMILTLEDKCEAKAKSDLAKINFTYS